MEELFNGTAMAIKGLLNSFINIQDKMMEINLFQIVMAIIFLTVCISIIFYIIKNINKSSNIVSYDIGNAKSSYRRGNKHIAVYKGIKNGNVVYYKKIWNKNGKLIHDGSTKMDELFD